MIALLLAAAAAASVPAVCEGGPVLMVVAGPTHDRARMIAYAKAIADSGLYQKLGGYYVNVPRAAATFEGTPPPGYTTLIVRFPCLANARAFWNSAEYRNRIKPLRLNPSAGDYLVTVYPEAPLRPDMARKVGDNDYRVRFGAEGITQVAMQDLVTDSGPADLSPRTIMERAIAAAGGDAWLNPRTLTMRGRAVFYAPDGAQPRTQADDYRMWRVYNPDRTVSHGAHGKVLIRARSGARTLFEVGFDGNTSWNERGVIPKAEADAYWASAFGFGIIRQAFKPGFKLDRVPDDRQGERPVYKLRLTDPKGAQTLFGIDQQSFAIRTMEFATPKGWHLRTYEDFVELENPRWMQARKVTLFYNGVKQNEVFWTDVVVDAPINDALFKPPERTIAS